MACMLARALVAFLLLVAAAGAHPARAQNYDGDAIVRVGLFAQGQWIDVNQTLPLPAASGDLSGFSGGVTAGYDFWRTSRFVLGFEADLSVGDIQDTVGTTSHGLDYLVTLRGRAGVYMHPNWLLYATGGVAWLGVEAQTPLGKEADTLTGWTAGGGTEVDWRHMILFAEYLYTDFGSHTYSLGGVPGRADYDGHLLRLGVKFKVGHDYFHGSFHDDYARPVK